MTLSRRFPVPFPAVTQARLRVNMQMVKCCRIIECILHANPWKTLCVSRKSPKLTSRGGGMQIIWCWLSVSVYKPNTALGNRIFVSVFLGQCKFNLVYQVRSRGEFARLAGRLVNQTCIWRRSQMLINQRTRADRPEWAGTPWTLCPAHWRQYSCSSQSHFQTLELSEGRKEQK